MTDIVLAVPIEAASFQRATEAVSEEVAARVREWPAVTVIVDGVAYIPLRTDWMPPKERRTADGIEVLVDGGRPDQWPPEVQAAIEAGRFARISSRVVDELWKVLHGGQNMEKAGDINVPSPDGGAAAAVAVAAEEADAGSVEAVPEERPEAAPAESEEKNEGIASCGLLGVNDEQSENSGQNEAIEAIEPVISDEVIDRLTLDAGGLDDLTRTIKTLEHYGAKFPPWFCDQPIEAVRAGLKDAARSERVRRAARLEREAEGERQEETRFDSFYAVNPKTGAVSLHYSEIAEYIADTLHAVTYRGTIYVYDRAMGIHRPNDTDVEQMTQDIAERCGYNGRITTAKREVLSYVAAKDVRREYPFNRCPGIPAANGVVRVDYVTGERTLEPHQPENLYTYRLPVAFDPEARTEEIDAVVASWVDEDARAILYQIPAQALLQATIAPKPYKKSYIIHGDANAAKSSYLELLRRCFGDENTSRVALQRIGQDRFCLASMEGKLFNIYDDLDDVPMQNSTVLKTLTGFDMHDVERKGVDAYRARIFCVHVYTCNRPPETPERVQNDAAFWERWEYITFPNYFPVDPGWYDRVLTPENCSAFLNRVLDLAVEIMRQGGLVIKSNAYDVRDRWKTNSDPIYKFIQENMDRSETGHVHKQEMYDAFLAFAHTEGVGESKIPLTLDMFAQAIFKYGFSPARVRIDKKRVYVFQGYVWKSSSQYKPRGTVDSTLVGGGA